MASLSTGFRADAVGWRRLTIWRAVRESTGMTPATPRIELTPNAALYGGFALLCLTKLGDVTSTALGLAMTSSLTERNQLMRGLMVDHGTLAALVASTAAALILTALVTEGVLAGLRRVTTLSPRYRIAFRLVGYGVPAVLNAAVTAHNVRLIVQAA